MTGDRTLVEGSIRLYRMEGQEGDASVQVATGIDPEDGSTVVFVRLGLIVSAMSPEGAAKLAEGLAVEAAYALVQRDQARSGGDA